jgi:DNA-binding NarL/FixJ family response regulator
VEQADTQPVGRSRRAGDAEEALRRGVPLRPPTRALGILARHWGSQNRILVRAPIAPYRDGLAEALGRAGYAADSGEHSDQDRRGESVAGVLATVAATSADLAEFRSLVGRRNVPVVALAVNPEPRFCLELLRRGARAAIGWGTEPDLIVVVLTLVLEGLSVMPWPTDGLLSEVGISEAEADMLRAVADGMTVAALSIRLGYSERETYRRLSAVYQRLGVGRRADALARARSMGLLAAPFGAASG